MPDVSNDVVLNLSCSLGAFPASSLKDHATEHGSNQSDLISAGIVSQDSAETHFRFFQENLNPYIHYIISEKDLLSDVRARSTQLATAIMTGLRTMPIKNGGTCPVHYDPKSESCGTDRIMLLLERRMSVQSI